MFLRSGRSESERAFERLLEEVGGSSSTPASLTTASNFDQLNGDHQLEKGIHPQPSDHSPTAPVTDDGYRAFLKSSSTRLVALSRASTTKPAESGSVRECQSQPSKNSPRVSVPNGMGRSESEWAFERLLEEVGGSSSTPASSTTASNSDQLNGDHQLEKGIHPQSSDHSPTASVTDEGYRAFLKSRLDLACATVALSRASTTKPVESGSVRECQSQPSKNSPGGSVPNGSDDFEDKYDHMGFGSDYGEY